MEGCFPRDQVNSDLCTNWLMWGETGPCGLALRAAWKDAACRGPGTAPRPICV